MFYGVKRGSVVKKCRIRIAHSCCRGFASDQQSEDVILQSGTSDRPLGQLWEACSLKILP